MHIFCAKFAPYEMKWCSDIKSMLRLSANAAAAAGSQECRFMTRGNAAVIHWSMHVLINALQALV